MNQRNSFSGLLSTAIGAELWKAVMIVLVLPCMGALALRRSVLADADFLGGRPEIQRFFRVNLCCLILTAVILAAEVFLFYKFCVGKHNTGAKLTAFIGSMAVVFVTAAIFTFSVVNISRDLHGVTRAELDDYVLSVSGSNYYLGFYDGGENVQMPITGSLYEELSGGEVRTDGLHSNIFDMITEAGYSSVTEYKNGLTVEYYFHSAMIESAKLT